MKRQLLLIMLAVVFYLTSAASQTDTLPGPDFTKCPKVTILGIQHESLSPVSQNNNALPLVQDPIRLKYSPDTYQIKKNLSQDLDYLKIQHRNNEWRNFFSSFSPYLKQ